MVFFCFYYMQEQKVVTIFSAPNYCYRCGEFRYYFGSEKQEQSEVWYPYHYVMTWVESKLGMFYSESLPSSSCLRLWPSAGNMASILEVDDNMEHTFIQVSFFPLVWLQAGICCLTYACAFTPAHLHVQMHMRYMRVCIHIQKYMQSAQDIIPITMLFVSRHTHIYS